MKTTINLKEEVKSMSDKELKEAYRQLDEQINKVECFGRFELVFREVLDEEMTKRSIEMEIEMEDLNKEEKELYNKLQKFIKEKDKQKFNKILSEYIDTQIELEKGCNQ